MPCSMMSDYTSGDAALSEVRRLEDEVRRLRDKPVSEFTQVDRMANMLCWVIRKIPEDQRKLLREDILLWWQAHEAFDRQQGR